MEQSAWHLAVGNPSKQTGYLGEFCTFAEGVARRCTMNTNAKLLYES